MTITVEASENQTYLLSYQPNPFHATDTVAAADRELRVSPWISHSWNGILVFSNGVKSVITKNVLKR